MTENPDETTRASSDRSTIIERMRRASEWSEHRRIRWQEWQQRLPARDPARFEDLPEYRRIAMQRLTGEVAGVANPFHRSHDRAAGATTSIGGQPMVNFASYDYLGTNTDPRVAAAVGDAVARFGVSASASRLVAGERPAHAMLESKLAAIYDTEAALCFVSGYLTNVATIACLMGPKDLVIHDELIHNSVLAGIRQSAATRRLFRHNRIGELESILRDASSSFRRVLVVVEGIYSMDGDIADLPGLLDLRSRYGFWLMVDEAHALGVLGRRGHGTFEHFGIDPKNVDIWMGTLSKAASSCGGYVAGSAALVEVLKAEAGGFVYSVGLAPALAAAASAGLDILTQEPERTARLKRNGTIFLQHAREAGLDTGSSNGFSIIPVVVGDSLRAVQLSNDLQDEGINVLPIIHPAVAEGMARLRFFMTCDHTEAQIGQAVEATARRLKALQASNFGLASLDADKLALSLPSALQGDRQYRSEI